LDIEDEGLLAKVRNVQVNLSAIAPDLKLVKTDKIHVTLLFLGEIPERIASVLCQGLASKRMPGISISLAKIGVFPDIRFARVIWIGIQDTSGTLPIYADSVRSLVLESGIQISSEKFVPHLTIARVRSGKNKENLMECVMRMSEIDLGPTRTSPLRLKKSELMSNAPVYSTVCEANP
jgi:2'-5' RNA ligase